MKHRGCFPAADVDLGAALVKAGIVDAGTPLSASAALMGFRLHHAVTDVTVSVRLMLVQVTQIIFEARGAWLAAQGVDFNRSFFVPEPHPVFGVDLNLHEDCYHKDKCVANAIRGDRSGESGGMLVRRAEVLRAVRGVRDLAHIVAIVSPNADSQNVVCALELLQNRKLQRLLEELGFWRAAGTLKVFGRGCQAFSAEGLSREKRREYHADEAALIKAVFGERLAVVEALTAGDAAGGFPRDQLLSRLCNIISLQNWQLLHPHLVATLVDMSLSTDDNEQEFGMLQRIAKFKPHAEVALGVLRNQDVLVNAKQDPSLNFVVAASSKAKYLHAQHREQKETRWSDPELLEREGAGKEKHHASLTSGASGYVRKKRAVRNFHTT